MREGFRLLLVAAAVLCGGAGLYGAEPIDVYLIGGQSNATGQGYLRNLPPEVKPDPRVRLFHSGRPHLDSGAEPRTWIPLRGASESPDRFGPELGFGNRLQELEPQRRIAVIKHAHSGSNLHEDWAPGRDPADRGAWGPQFLVFVETVEAGLRALREQGFAPVLRGMLWQQGESDAKNADAARDYGRNLGRFIRRVREQFAAPELLFVYGYVLPPGTEAIGRTAVRVGQRQVAQGSRTPLAIRGAHLVATDDLSHRADDQDTIHPDDHLHFGTAGTYELGRRMAERMHAAGTRERTGKGSGRTAP